MRRFVMVIVMALVLFHGICHAGDVRIFGPQQYARATTATTGFKDTFPARAGVGRLVIINGRWDGERRVDGQVSSARVGFNGVEIYGPSAFNKNVSRLETPLALLTDNTLTVELNGSPESFITIEVWQIITPPTLSINASPTAIHRPESSLLSWASSNADTVTLDNGIGIVSPTGTLRVSPSVSTTYTAVATNRFSTTTAQVNIALLNSAPVAQPQTIATNEDTPVQLTLTALDVDADPLTYQVTASPSHGLLAGTAPNLTYQPAPNYHGKDGFSFTATDGEASTEPTVITITVTPVNDPPEAVADSFSTAEDTVLTRMDVVANDYDVDGDIRTVTGFSQGAHGTVIYNGDGTFNYTPEANYHGLDSFGYTISDTQNGTMGVVTITVTSVNDPPVAVIGEVQPVRAGNLVQLDGNLSNDIDGDALSFAWTFLSQPAGSSAIIANANQPEARFTTDLAGDYRVQLTVSDSSLSDTRISLITVQKALVSVPDCTGMSQASAEDAILSAKLRVGVVTKISSDSVPAGQVVSQHPVALTVEEEGSPIDLEISLGQDTVLPIVSFKALSTKIQKGETASLSWTTANATTVAIDQGLGIVAASGSTVVTPVATTTYTITASGLHGVESKRITVMVQGNPEPLPVGSFGEKYEDLIPKDATIVDYDTKRFALVTGTALDMTGMPLGSVAVSIHNKPEYGTVFTDSMGIFSLPAEGGGNLTIAFRKEGYLTTHRQIYVPWNDTAVIAPVQLTAQDEKGTAITFDGSPNTIIAHRGTEITDSSGSRSATLVFSGDNRAYSVDDQGNSIASLKSITARATEFVTPESMPAKLPPNSGFTYCVDLTVDGVERVKFDKPVFLWVENFLRFPVGEKVPVGYYDRDRGVWAPADNGLVVSLLDTDGDGIVDALDSDNDQLPNDLNGDTFFSDEVKGLENPLLYPPGSTFWRVPVRHFTPYDLNWPVAAPAGAIAPNPSGSASTDMPMDSDKDSNRCINSYVEEKSRIFHEDITIPGTDFTLHYNSARVAGYQTLITVPASGDTVPASLRRIIVTVEIAGRTMQQELPPLPNQVAEFVWDGLDHMGRPRGSASAHVKIGFVYGGVYWTAGNFAMSFGQAGAVSTGISARQDVINWQERDLFVQGLTKGDIAEGWTLSTHHLLDLANISTLHKGDGTILRNEAQVVSSVIGNGIYGFSGDGGPATAAQIQSSEGKTFDAAGNLYFVDRGNHRLRKVDTNGIITTVAGRGLKYSGQYFMGGFGGDGGPATEAYLYNPTDVAIDAAGNLYFADYSNHRIRKVDANGIITTMAGSGCSSETAYCYGGFSGDGGPATAALLRLPTGIEVDASGNIYFIDTGNRRIRKIDTNGIITTIAGAGEGNYAGEGMSAVSAILGSVYDMAIDKTGNMYLLLDGYRLCKIDPAGILTTIAGGVYPGFSGDGGPARAARFSAANLAVDLTGNIYLGDFNNYRIRKINTEGIITTIAGSGCIYGDWYCYGGFSGDGGPATDARFKFTSNLAIDPLGNLFITDDYNSRIRKIAPPISFADLMTAGDTAFAEKNGLAHIISPAGRHKTTFDLATGVVLRTFGYDQNHNIQTITDQFGNQTVIERDASGRPTAIVSADGVRTLLTIDASNNLSKVIYPNNTFYSFAYSPAGLLTAETDPNGNRFDHVFDTFGRLTDVYDPKGGHWVYSRTAYNNGDAEVDVMTAEGNLTSYLDHTASTGISTSTLTAPPGGVEQTTQSADGFSVTQALPCGVQIATKYAIDPEYKFKREKEISVRTPSGLSRLSAWDTIYEDTDADGAKDKVIVSTTVNGKTASTANNTLQSRIISTSPEGRVVTRQYNPNTLQTTGIVMAGLFDTANNFDIKGRLVSSQTGDRTTTYGYTPQGLLASVTDPESISTGFAYDGNGRLIEMSRPDGFSIRYAYDPNGNMTVLTTPTTVNHGFTYDGVDQQTSYVAPLSDTYSYMFDKDRQLTRVTFPSGFQINNIYDKTRLAQMQLPEGNIDYTYLCNSKIGSIRNVSATIAYGYDGSLLTSENLSGLLSQTLLYSYNNNFDIKSFTYAGATANYTYDMDSLLIGTGPFTITRNAGNGLPLSLSDSVFTETRTYNGYAELDQQTSTVKGQNLAAWSLARDKTGRITAKTETMNGTTHSDAYTYDLAGRLTSVIRNGLVVEEYAYDPNGNRIFENNALRGITGRTFSYSAEDHVITAGGETYQFDVDGFLVSRSDGTNTGNYHYSSRGELLSASLPDGRLIEYVYDPLQRRTAKKINGVIIEKYLWAGLTKLLAVYGGSGNLLARFEYGDNRMPVKMTSGSTAYYLVYDQVGSLREIADTNGNVIKTLEYDAFGNILADSNPALAVPFGFAGGLHDRDTGLVLFGYRDYSPNLGKWIAKDPIRFDGGDSNLYGYVQNNPVNRIDPMGLSDVTFDRGAGTITINNNQGSQVGQYPAGNNATSTSNGPWPNGTYDYSHYVPHPESGPNGPYGSNGNFVFDVPGRTGMGIHSGRKGPQSKTEGCIRSTDEATDFLRDLNSTDPLKTITVK